MTEIVVKDYEKQTIQRNAANAVNSVLAAVAQSQTFQVLSSATPFVVRPTNVAVPSIGGGTGNTGAYFAATPDPTNCGVEIHANSGVPYLDFGTVPTTDYEYRIAQDPVNGNKRLYVASTVAGGGEFFIAAQLTLGGTLVNQGTSAFRSSIGPFYIGPSLAFSANVTAAGGIANGFNSANFPYLMVRSGSIVGVSGFATASANSTVTLRAVLNGGNTTVAGSALTTTSSTAITASAARGAVPFNAGDNIRADLTSSVAANISAVYWVTVEFTP